MQSHRFFAIFTPVLVLAALLGACDNPVGDGGHRVARDLIITAADTTVIIARTQNNTQWVGAPLTLQPGEVREVRVFFVDPAGNRFQLPAAGASHTLHVRIGNPSVVAFESLSRERGNLRGLAPGTATMSFHIWHGVHPGGHEDWSTPDLPVVVAP